MNAPRCLFYFCLLQTLFALDDAFSAAVNPSKAFELFKEANSMYASSDFEAAVSTYKTALQYDSTKPDIFSNLGSVLADLNRLDQAAENYQRALEIDPSHTSALFNYGLLLQDSRDLNLAVSIYRRLIAVEAHNPDAFSNLGSCLYELALYNDAINAFETAIKLYESGHREGLLYNDELQYNDLVSNLLQYVGRSYARIDDSRLARLSFKKSLDMNPRNAVAAHMLASIDGISKDSAPAEYVSKLFDDYSSTFEASLSELKYTVPAVLATRLRELHNEYQSVVDLGSGTGLFGKELVDSGTNVQCLFGVDLSYKMLQTSIKKGVYNFLVCGDIVNFLSEISSYPSQSEILTDTNCLKADRVYDSEDLKLLSLKSRFHRTDNQAPSAIIAADVFGNPYFLFQFVLKRLCTHSIFILFILYALKM
jgi:predicted TPR repeat methyltransferase